MLRRVLLALPIVLAPVLAVAEPAGRPAWIPDAEWNQVKGLVDASRVRWDPYQGLAIKKDGSPYRVLYIAVWLGDDYQVVGNALVKSELEAAGAKVTLLSVEHSAQAEAQALENAIATHAYDAVIVQPIDDESLNAIVEKAEDAGIDVYNWVSRVKTDKLAGWAGYQPDRIDANGQIGAKFLDLANAAGATPEKPFRVLEIWGVRAEQTCVRRHNGFHMGLQSSPNVAVVESVDTVGQPELMIKAIQDAFARYPDIKGIYPQFGNAEAIAEGLRLVGHLAPQGDPNHVVVILQDIDKSMLVRLKDGTVDYTVSNNPWHQIDVVMKELLWHTVLKQQLNEGDALSGKVKYPKNVLLPMPFLSSKTIQTPAAQMWGGTVAFTDMPLGKWKDWPVLDTSEIGLPTPTIDDRKRLLGY